MKTFLRQVLLPALAILAPMTTVLASPIVRTPGAIYLSDFGQKPLKLKLSQSADCYFDPDFGRFAGTLLFPQIVQVEAVTDTAFRIRGNAKQGGVAAWVDPKFLIGVPPDLIANLKKSEERRQIVEALVAKNEVAIGMTMDEVGRSLGKPKKKTNRADKTSTQTTWEYIKYELVPQTTYAPGYSQSVVNIPGNNNKPTSTIVTTGGGYYPSTTYVKTPVGSLKVTFKDGIVESLDQSEGTLIGGGQQSIVTPPIMVYW